MTDQPFDLGRYEACVFDLDGTVWLGRRAIDGAIGFLDRVRAQGSAIAFATNAIVQSPDDLSAQLVQLGLARADEPVVTGGTVMATTVAASGARSVAAVVPPALRAQLVDVGLHVVDPDDVDPSSWGAPDVANALVMAASRAATIGSIERIGRLADAGHRLYLSSQDPGFPSDGGIEPGGGALLAALRSMYDVEPITVGKPSRFYADAVAAALGRPTGRMAMFGDSQHADMGIALHLGADGILLTGHSVRPVDHELTAPTYVCASLADQPVAYRVVA